MPSTITPCLWFDLEAEEAAAFYTSLFPNSRITETTHYNEAGMRPAGTVMTVAFELDGRPFVALNGGTQFTFSEAISFQVPCDSQEEVDRYWDGLRRGRRARAVRLGEGPLRRVLAGLPAAPDRAAARRPTPRPASASPRRC